jgi:glyoxylase-like metal-dependent hydrolase (beta-lactamase superfamily II)
MANEQEKGRGSDAQAERAPEAIVEGLALGPFQTNTYVVKCAETGKGAIIDPGFESDLILQAVEELAVDVEWILLTHGHVDHVSAAGPVARKLDVGIAIHSEDAPHLASAPEMARMFGLSAERPPQATKELDDGDIIEIGKLRIKAIHTPGHTPGGLSFHLSEQSMLFCGDTLFYRGIGRTDLPGGSFAALSTSIRTKIYALDGDTTVYPGHGPKTTIREEMFSNPFVTL